MINIIDFSNPIYIAPVILFLVFLAPRCIRYIIPIVLSYRRRREKSSLMTEIVEYKKELQQISQVNEFAKYSKLQRKLRVIQDKLGTINREDFELNFKYVLGAQALAWLVAAIFLVRLAHQLYQLISYQLGFV